jgi:hypothetical protein
VSDDHAEHSDLPTGTSAESHSATGDTLAARMQLAVAMAIVLTIALFVVRSRWLGLAVLTGGDALVYVLWRRWARP